MHFTYLQLILTNKLNVVMQYAGGLTTPIDVVKTRLMLSTKNEGVVTVIRELYKGGLSSFFKGFSARIGWLSIGGFVYLGTYQTVIEFIV